ncbi:MAG TPA: vWA domain-containing protein [Candidatus Angelobacter sp.]
MKIKRTLIALMLAAALLGCGKREPRHIVILPDVSGSIDRQSLEQAFKAIDELVSNLQRGDRIAIIPILSDAQVEASGQIIRFEVPKTRKAYDADLRQFAMTLKASLRKLESAAVLHPGAKTDILGSMYLVNQDFQADTGDSKRFLVVLSDFIQEDGELDFKMDKHLESPATASQFAAIAAEKDGLDFPNLPVYLGSLRSSEYSRLARGRRAGIQAFWINYFKSHHGKPMFSIDGAGLLRRYSMQ